MKRSHIYSTLCCCVFTLITTSSSAELIDRGGGLIYDSDQDLTWTQDAQMFSGSWDAAMAWAENLVLGDVDGWRLPTTTQFDDPTCSGDVRVSINPSYPLIYEHRLGCLGGEMELFTALYDPWNNDLFKYIDAEGKVQRYINRTRYWAATHYRDGTDPCIYYPDYDAPCTITTQEGDNINFRWQWGFTGAGDIEEPYKTTLKKGNGRYAWAVHDGDVGAGAIPTPEIRVTDSAGPAADLQMPFGDIIEMTSADGTVTVTNLGEQDLVIGQIAFTDLLAAPFSIPNDVCSNQTLTQGMSCNLTVSYSPPVTGASSDSFSIPSNDADEDPVIFNVSGTGISASAPEITVTDSVDPGDDLQVLFGEVTEMTASDQTVTISNAGAVNLNIGQIAAANSLAAPFSVINDNCSNQAVAPAANCSLTVRFAPSSAGASSDSFDIPSNDGDENPVTINVSGTGTETALLDSNGDGLLDADAIALGLDPKDPDGDTDNDSEPDVTEVGPDVKNALDNDGDGIIDALEPGATARNAEVASGLRLVNGDTVIITTAPGERLSNVSADAAVDGPIGINFLLGTISYKTTSPPGGSVTVRMSFSADLPDRLVINKVDRANNYTELPDILWNQVGDRSVEITLTDGDPQTDLDRTADGLIDDPVAIGSTATDGGGGGGGGGCTIGTTAKMDPTWLLILLVPGIRYLRRYRVSPAPRGSLAAYTWPAFRSQ